MATINLQDMIFGYQKRNKIQNMQDIESSMYLWLEELINNQFEYTNLPKDIPFDIIERVLFHYGQGVLFKVGSSFFFLPCCQTGNLSIYGRPTTVQAIGLNGQSYNTTLNIEDEYDNNFNLINKCNAILFLNNEQAIPTYTLIKPYMNRLMYLWQSIGINECLNRCRGLICCNKDISKAMKEQFTQLFEGYSPFAIVNDKSMSSESMNINNFNVEYIANDIWVDFDNTLNKLLNVIGVKNINTQKKERLITDETTANDDLVNYSLLSRLKYRKNAIERTNEMFNTNIQINKEESQNEPKNKENEENKKGV